MARTPENLIKHELIGLTIAVEKSTDPTQIGAKGRIIGETKNTIMLLTSKGERTVQKEGAIFDVSVNGKNVRIDGKTLAKTPEERTKAPVKKW